VEGPRGELVPGTDPAWPVFAIPAAAALAYCRWFGRKIGRAVRLLTEIEWEKCARGADGRLYPWGNRFDWSFTKGGRSREGEPYPEPVGRFPADRSPYGIRDLAGCVRELTDGWFAEGHRACRGGSWFNGFEIVFRADFRTPCREGNRVTDVGFRVAFGGAPGAGGGAP
jgi:formylglycine-generating enzyme required for sulfatase activity